MTLTLELTIPTLLKDQYLEELEVSRGRSRDEFGIVLQTDKEYFGMFLEETIEHHLVEGRKILHKRAYDSGLDLTIDVDVNVL